MLNYYKGCDCNPKPQVFITQSTNYRYVSKCSICGKSKWWKEYKREKDNMYRCICGQNYILPPVIDEMLQLVSEDYPVVEAVVICPGCDSKGLKGGEYHWDEFTDSDGIDRSRPAVMMFGADFILKKHKEKLTLHEDGSLSVLYPVVMGIPTDNPLHVKVAQPS